MDALSYTWFELVSFGILGNDTSRHVVMASEWGFRFYSGLIGVHTVALAVTCVGFGNPE